MKNILTGITPSGSPHIGNYIGAIKPAILKSKETNDNYFYFLSDYHALIKCQSPELVNQYSIEVAVSWLCLGLDIDKVTFYRQSKVSQVTELAWILSCITPKGLLNRAHAYKSAVDINTSEQKDKDKNITMGLYSYPVLMAADILIFDSDIVPVGKDQVQHIEIARDIANYFNKKYKNIFSLPQAEVTSDDVLVGLDGRKMSKSYDNTIPLFSTEKVLKKRIMKIATNSLEPGEPKDHSTCSLFKIYKEFADKEEIETIKTRYKNGISWGEMKIILFEKVNSVLEQPRKKYQYYMDNLDEVEELLEKGEKKAKLLASKKIALIKDAIGLKKFSN